jgi:hypothetical protein
MQYFLPLLAVLLIGLKLTGYITWSWWLVLAPLLVGPVIVLIMFVIFGFVVLKTGGN